MISPETDAANLVKRKLTVYGCATDCLMRRSKTIVAGLAAIAALASAEAQELASDSGIGPYRFGMSMADVQATSPNASWQTQELEEGDLALSGGPRLVIGGSRFGGVLAFRNDALSAIILNGTSSSNCEQLVSGLVQELELDYGPFNSAPGPAEAKSFRRVSMTAGGSEIRIREVEDEPLAVSASRRVGGMFVQVIGNQSADLSACGVSIAFSAPAIPAPLAETLAELDRAQTMVHPQWIRRPTGLSFANYYPSEALDDRIDGSAVLDCIVNTDGSLRCIVSSETPAGAGFGAAALGIAQDFRVLHDETGNDAVGKRIRVPIGFRS